MLYLSHLDFRTQFFKVFCLDFLMGQVPYKIDLGTNLEPSTISPKIWNQQMKQWGSKILEDASNNLGHQKSHDFIVPISVERHHKKGYESSFKYSSTIHDGYTLPWSLPMVNSEFVADWDQKQCGHSKHIDKGHPWGFILERQQASSLAARAGSSTENELRNRS